jgi:hypothetical protein
MIVNIYYIIIEKANKQARTNDFFGLWDPAAVQPPQDPKANL